jgi:general secretion pathway protein J
MTRRTDGGFTLLEIIVALVVFGLLLAGLSQGVRYGLQAWQSQVRLAGRQTDLDAVDRTLRHMIRVMDPGSGMDPAPVTGSRDRLSFVTSLPAAPGTDGTPQRVTATLLLDAHRLELRWQPDLHATWLQRPPPGQQTLLEPNVAGLTLSYWQPQGGWVSAWRGPNLPALVRLRVTFPPGDARHWPDIVIAPLLDRS